MKTESSNTLHIVSSSDTASSHDAPGVDELRLIVRALADIREALHSPDGPGPIDSTV